MKKKFLKRSRRAFTLIELLVVIAIIGILATVIIINVSATRGKAIDASVLSSMSKAQKTAAACVTEGFTLNYLPIPNNGFPDVTLNICAASSTWTDKWPDISSLGKGNCKTSQWFYAAPLSTSIAGGKTLTSAVNSDFTFGAIVSGCGYSIGCDINNCGKTGF